MNFYYSCILLILSVTLSINSAFSREYVIGNKRLTFITDNLVRLEYALNGKFLNDSTLFAVVRSYDDVDVEVERHGRRHKYKTSAMCVEIDDDGFPYGQNNLLVRFNHLGKEHKWKVSNTQQNNLHGAIPTLDGVSGYAQRMEGLLSRDGWYMINDSGKDVYKNGELKLRDRNHVQDFYLFVYGLDYKAALKSLSAVSGTVPMTRKYVHGSWYCRWWPYTADDYRTILSEYNEHDFPIDIIVFDMDWHKKKYSNGCGHAGTRGWTGYSWNRDLIPDPQALISEFKQQDIHVVLNEHPHDGLRPEDDSYDAFIRELGKNKADDIPLFDAGDKQYMDAFMKHSHGESDSMGVAFWWLDWQQDYIYPVVRGTTTQHLPWLNELYYNYFSKNNQRGINFSRWGGWGDHRHPIQFSGDAVGNWNTLKFEIDLTTTSGNSGCFFWAHDIGGFYGGLDPELYTRWTQFGLLNSSLRIHSVVGKEYDRRPWLWGDEYEKAMRKVYHMRSQLMPYIYSSVRQCHTDMLPLNRGLYIEHPDCEESYKHPESFFFGDLIFASPVCSPGEGPNKTVNKEIWFPEGLWYSIFNGKSYIGGKTHPVSCPLDDSPVFVKGGWVLPMQKYTPRMSSSVLDHLILRCYPGIEGDDNTYQLYEDDGITNEYKNGKFATTGLTYRKKNGVVEVSVSEVSGTYSGQPEKRSYEILLYDIARPSKVRMNGKRVKYIYDEEIRGIRVTIDKKSIRKGFKITVY